MLHLLDNGDILYNKNVIQAFNELIKENSRTIFDNKFLEDV